MLFVIIVISDSVGLRRSGKNFMRTMRKTRAWTISTSGSEVGSPILGLLDWLTIHNAPLASLSHSGSLVCNNLFAFAINDLLQQVLVVVKEFLIPNVSTNFWFGIARLSRVESSRIDIASLRSLIRTGVRSFKISRRHANEKKRNKVINCQTKTSSNGIV